MYMIFQENNDVLRVTGCYYMDKKVSVSRNVP